MLTFGLSESEPYRPPPVKVRIRTSCGKVLYVIAWLGVPAAPGCPLTKVVVCGASSLLPRQAVSRSVSSSSPTEIKICAGCAACGLLLMQCLGFTLNAPRFVRIKAIFLFSIVANQESQVQFLLSIRYNMPYRCQWLLTVRRNGSRSFCRPVWRP